MSTSSPPESSVFFRPEMDASRRARPLIARWRRRGLDEYFAWRDARARRAKWWVGARGVAAVTIVIQLSMILWAYRHQLIYGFGDSLSHMTIARRLWDSPNPGLSQFGTTWLPLPHVFFSLSSISLWAWRSGVGGSLTTLVCAVIASVTLYRIGQRTGVGNAGGWLAAMLMATNPSWSYVSAVPMTEPFTMALTCLTVAGLLRWSQSDERYSAGMTALFCGLPAAADILTRYEAWSFVGFAGLALAWLSWRRHGWSVTMRHQIYAYAIPPLLAITWWLVFNWSVYGSPIAFEEGRYSSRALVAPFATLGLIYGKGNAAAASALYGKDVIDVAGITLFVLAFVGLAITLVRWRGMAHELWLCFAGIPAFIILSIYQGQIYIRLPQMIPYGIENARYGVEALPLLAVAGAQILRLVPGSWTRPRLHVVQRWVAVGVLVLASGGWLVGVANASLPAQSIAVLEAKSNTAADLAQRNAAQWLHTHATKGFILLDDTVFPVIPLIGFDLHRVIVTSSGLQFRTLLAHPREATWVAVEPGNRRDQVWAALSRDRVFNTVFFPVAAFGRFVIYKQQPAGQQFLSNTLLTVPYLETH